MSNAGLKLIDRFITVHRPDCEALRVDVPKSQAKEESFALCEEDDVRLRRPFDELRRLIGQIAGLLLLAEVSARREVVEAPTLEKASEKLREVGAAIEEMQPKLRNPAAIAAYPAVAGHIGYAIDALRLAAGPASPLEVGPALARIKAAYDLLQRMAEPDRGRSMVDFNQACCSCSGAEALITTVKRGR